MPRTRVVIVVSDFHVGRGDAPDSFRADAAFLKLCRALARYVRDEDVALTVGMNGDMLDTWAIAPDAELQPGATDLLRGIIEFPANTSERKTAAVTRGLGQITQAFTAHPKARAWILISHSTRDWSDVRNGPRSAERSWSQAAAILPQVPGVGRR